MIPRKLVISMTMCVTRSDLDRAAARRDRGDFRRIRPEHGRYLGRKLLQPFGFIQHRAQFLVKGERRQAVG